MLDITLQEIAAQLKRIADELEAQGRKNIVTNEDFSHSPDRYAEHNALLTSDTLISNLEEVCEMGSNRFLSICRRAGIETLGQLAARTELEFWVTKNCGWKTVAEARSILQAAGLAFQLSSKKTS